MQVDPVELPYDYYMVFESVSSVMPSVDCVLRAYNWSEGALDAIVKMTWTKPPLNVNVRIGSAGPGRTTVFIRSVVSSFRVADKGRPQLVADALLAELVKYLAAWQAEIDAANPPVVPSNP